VVTVELVFGVGGLAVARCLFRGIALSTAEGILDERTGVDCVLTVRRLQLAFF